MTHQYGIDTVEQLELHCRLREAGGPSDPPTGVYAVCGGQRFRMTGSHSEGGNMVLDLVGVDECAELPSRNAIREQQELRMWRLLHPARAS